MIETLIRKLGQRYGERLWQLAVGELEVSSSSPSCDTVMIHADIRFQVCVRLRGLGPDPTPLRFVVVNPTGLDFEVSGYYQLKDLRTGQG